MIQPSDELRGRDPVHAGYLDVHQDEIISVGLDRLDCIYAARDHVYGIPVDEIPEGGIEVDEGRAPEGSRRANLTMRSDAGVALASGGTVTSILWLW